MKSERKYKYWHKVVDAHPAKKRELLRLMKPKTLTDLILDLAYPHNHKPTHRVTATCHQGGENWGNWRFMDFVQRCRGDARKVTPATLSRSVE